jgi:hypothetical protein
VTAAAEADSLVICSMATLLQITSYEQGSSEIGAAVLLRLARKSGRTIEWLLTGKDTL